MTLNTHIYWELNLLGYRLEKPGKDAKKGFRNWSNGKTQITELPRGWDATALGQGNNITNDKMYELLEKEIIVLDIINLTLILCPSVYQTMAMHKHKTSK